MATAKSSKKSKPSARQPSVPTAKKSLPVSADVSTAEATRRLKVPKRKLLRRQEKRFRSRPKLPSAFKITRQAARLLITNWRVIGGIVLLYGLLNIILVRGLNGGANVGELKDQANAAFQGGGANVISGLTVIGLLLTSSNNVASAAASAYQSFLLLIISLVLVWSYRQLLAGIKIRVRDGFYRGVAPLIPALLVLLVVGLEILPLLLGSWLYATLIQGGIAITGLEKLVAFVILIVSIAISVYLACSTIFALYIVTLADMTPLRAMRSARDLVRYRRWSIIRKLLFLPLLLLIIVVVIMLPFVLYVTVIAQWIFFLLTMFMLAAVHAYLYVLYRELLNE